jgi:putative sporulation protein YyaC
MVLKFDVLCLGSPDVKGDALGPLVGTMLSYQTFKRDVKIIGTMDKPVIRSNYRERLKELRDDAFLIVVDAAYGEEPGIVRISNSPLSPGSAVSTIIKPVGDMSIKVYMAKTFFRFYTCNVDVVHDWAKAISTKLMDLFVLTNKKVYIDK